MIDPCPVSQRNPNGAYDCGRTFTGMSSDGRTPTAIVADIVGMSRKDCIEALRASFDAKGWCPCCAARPVDVVIDELISFGGCKPAGTLVGRCLNSLIVLIEPEGWGSAAPPVSGRRISTCSTVTGGDERSLGRSYSLHVSHSRFPENIAIGQR